MTPVRLEPAALQARVKHSATEPLRSLEREREREGTCGFTTCTYYTSVHTSTLTFSENVRCEAFLNTFTELLAINQSQLAYFLTFVVEQFRFNLGDSSVVIHSNIHSMGNPRF